MRKDEVIHQYEITKEIYNIKNDFEDNTDAEAFGYSAKAFSHISFNPNEKPVYTKTMGVGEWTFPIKQNKQEMLILLEDVFKVNNMRLTGLIINHLNKKGVQLGTRDIIVLDWNSNWPVHKWDYKTEPITWLLNLPDTGRTEWIKLQEKSNFNNMFCSLHIEELILAAVYERTGLDDLPDEAIRWICKIEQWIEDNEDY